MVCEKFVGCNGDESMQVDGYSWIEGTGGQQCDGETGRWSVTQATVSSSSAESEAKAITKGCIVALYVKHLLEHQTAKNVQN